MDTINALIVPAVVGLAIIGAGAALRFAARWVRDYTRKTPSKADDIAGELAGDVLEELGHSLKPPRR